MRHSLTDLDEYDAMETPQRMGMPNIQDGAVNVQDGIAYFYLSHIIPYETKIGG